MVQTPLHDHLVDERENTIRLETATQIGALCGGKYYTLPL